VGPGSHWRCGRGPGEPSMLLDRGTSRTEEGERRPHLGQMAKGAWTLSLAEVWIAVAVLESRRHPPGWPASSNGFAITCIGSING
jgi:hypothetical protein